MAAKAPQGSKSTRLTTTVLAASMIGVALGAFAPVALAIPPPSVELILDDATAAQGGNATLSLRLTNLSDFGRLSVNLSYDDSAVTVGSASPGTVPDSSVTVFAPGFPSPGTLSLQVTRASNATSIAGNYVVATINASGNAPGHFAFNFTNALLEPFGGGAPIAIAFQRNASLDVTSGGGGGGCGGPTGFIAGLARVNASSLNAPANNISVRAHSTCGQASQSLAGDFAAGVGFNLTNLSTSTSWTLEILADNDGDGNPSMGDFVTTHTPNLTFGAGGIVQDITLQGGNGGGGGGGGSCSGPGAIAGVVHYYGTSPGNMMVRARGSCNSASFSANGTNPVDGLTFEITNLPSSGSFDVEAWIDEGNGQFDGTEPIGSQPGVAVGVTTVNFTIGGGGCGPDGCPGGGSGGGGFGGGCNDADRANVTGLVQDESGNFLASVGVQFQSRDANEGQFGSTDESGAYACALGAGNWTLSIFSPQGQFFQDLTLASNTTTWVNATVSFNNRPAYHWPSTFYGGTLWGNVTVGGAPAANVRLNVWGQDCQEGGWDQQLRLMCGGEAVTGANGTFVFTGLGNGTFNLNVDGSSSDLPNRYVQAFAAIEGADPGSVQAQETGNVAFAAPGYVRGWVRTTNGTPIANAQVNFWPQCNSPGESCQGGWGQTNATGYFSVSVGEGLYGGSASTGFDYHGPPLSNDNVNCNPYDGGMTCINVTVGNVAWHNFTLAAGAVITGRVVDADGNPVRAFVNAFEPNPGFGGPSNFGWGQTDFSGSGFFNVTVQPGNYTVRVEADRFERPDLGITTTNGVLVTSGNTTDMGSVVLAPGAMVKGYVVDADGAPVAWTNVFANVHFDKNSPPPPGTDMWGGNGFTNDEGYYEIRGMSPNNYDIVVEPGYGASFMRTQATRNVTSGSTTWLNITVGDGGTIRGYVTDKNGAPVPFANVDAYWQPKPVFNKPMGGGGECKDCGGGGGGGGPQEDAATGADGSGGSNTLSGTWSYVGNHTGLTILFFAATDSTGEPFTTMDTAANGTGSYSIANVPNGRWRVGAFIDVNGNGEPDANDSVGFAPGAMEPLQRNVTNVSGNLAQDIELRDAPEGGWPMGGNGGGDQGGCTDCGGGGPVGPMDDKQQQMPESGAWGHATTDANGHYAIKGLANGTFGMFVRPPFGTSYSTASLDPWRGDDIPNVTVGGTSWQNFTLATGSVLHGCVQDANGDPVQYAWTNAWSPTSFGGGEPTLGDGCFTIRGVLPGTYTLEIQPPYGSDLARFRQEGIVVPEGETVELGTLRMSAGIGFSGHVLANGTGVANAFVNVFEIMDGPNNGPGNYGFAQTDETGAFNVRGLEEGKYGVQVQPPFGSNYSSKFIPQLRINASGLSDYNITLSQGGRITGRVLNATGSPVQNAWVGAWSFTAASGAGAITDAGGNFTLTGLAASDDYNLDVFPPFDQPNLAGYHDFPLAVPDGGTLALGDVNLSAGGQLVGHVADADGNALQNAFVNVGGRGTFGWGMTDADGNFTVPGLRATPGQSLDVLVQAPFGQGYVPTRVTHVWAPNDQGVSDVGNVTLDSGKTLTGRITRGGSAVADANVYVWPAQPYHGPPVGGSATTDASGWYNVTGLPAGDWDVKVDPNDGGQGNFTTRAVTIASGDSTVYYNVSLASASASIQVTLGSGGSPVQGAQVSCFNPTLHAGRGGTTDASGQVTFTGLPAGVFDCRYFAPGYAPGHANVTASEGTTATLTNSTMISTTTRAVTGNYTATNGSASGLMVLLVPQGGVHEDDRTGFNVTAADGSFVVAGMPPAAYDLKVLDSNGTQLATTAVDLTAADQDVSLSGPGA